MAFKPSKLFKPRVSTPAFVVDFKKTFTNLKAAVDKLRIIEPPKEEGGKPKVKELIKGNVYSTAKEIYRLLMNENNSSSRPKTIALRTKNPSLAKLCHNSARTIQRHIEKLVEHGILHAKARLNHGIQLLLDPALIVYKPEPGKDYPVGDMVAVEPAPVAPSIDAKIASKLSELENQLTSKFSMNRALGAP